MELWDYIFHFSDQHKIFCLTIKFIFLFDYLMLAIWFFNHFDNFLSYLQNFLYSFKSTLPSQKVFCFEQNWGFRLEYFFYFFSYFFHLSAQKFFQFIFGKGFELILLIYLNYGHLVLDQFLNCPENRLFALSVLDLDSAFISVPFLVTNVLDKLVKVILFFCWFLWLIDDKILQYFISILSIFKLDLIKLFLVLQKFWWIISVI